MSTSNKQQQRTFTPSSIQQEFLEYTDKQAMAYGGFGGGKCVRADTRIRLADGGTKEIRNMERGDTVLSLDTDSLEIVERPVRAVLETGTKDVFRVSINGLTDVYVSEDHPFYTITEKTREYGANMWEGSEERRTIPSEFDWVDVTELEEQDCVAVPEYERVVGQDEMPHDMYWLLGYLIADGSLSRGYTVFSTQSDEIVSKVRDVVPDTVRVTDHKDELSYGIVGTESRNSNPVRKMIDRADMCRKSINKFVPEMVFDATKFARQQFLSGLFVGDASTANSRLEYDVASKQLRDDVYDLLHSLGIHASTADDEATGETEREFPRYRLDVKRGSELEKLARQLNLLHKQEALDKMAANKSNSLRGTNSHFDPDGKDVVFKRITDIECVGEAQTYDLEIAGTHNFIGNGVVLHNTRACAEKVYMLNVKYPGNRALIVRKNFSDVRSSTVEQSLLEDVIPESHIPEDGHNKSEHKIEHFTGTRDRNGQPVMSEIYYEGLDSKGSRSQDGLPRRVSGMQFGTIFIDEATETTESDYVQLLGRLRFSGREQAGQKFTVPFRQIMVATNPASPDHYLYDRFLSEDTPDNARAFKMRAEDNPGVPQDYVDDMKQNYSGVYYERYVEGEWVGTDAAVYDEFDRRRFVVGLEELRAMSGVGWSQSPIGNSRLITPPESWSVYRVMDFGYPSPTVCLWLAESPEVDEQDNRLYVVFREAYKPETLIEEMAEQYIEPFSQDVTVEQTFADPAQADSREALERRGIPTKSANKDVWNGIQEVKAQMSTELEPFGAQDETPESADPPVVPGVLFYEDSLLHEPDAGLADNNKPTRTIEEIAGYEWRDGQDEPVKEDDHGLDCLRYGIYTLQGDTGPSYDELEQLANALQQGF